jgi:hypothetical protein
MSSPVSYSTAFCHLAGCGTYRRRNFACGTLNDCCLKCVSRGEAYSRSADRGADKPPRDYRACPIKLPRNFQQPLTVAGSDDHHCMGLAAIALGMKST